MSNRPNSQLKRLQKEYPSFEGLTREDLRMMGQSALGMGGLHPAVNPCASSRLRLAHISVFVGLNHHELASWTKVASELEIILFDPVQDPKTAAAQKKPLDRVIRGFNEPKETFAPVRSTKSGTKTVGAKVSQWRHEQLKDLAKSSGNSLEEVVRQIIQHALGPEPE